MYAACSVYLRGELFYQSVHHVDSGADEVPGVVDCLYTASGLQMVAAVNQVDDAVEPGVERVPDTDSCALQQTDT